jgi:WD40 repeat protein
MYDLRGGRVQMINAHPGPVIAVAFSSDGKNLATYSVSDNKMNFWQTSTGMFGLGNAQTKCTRYTWQLTHKLGLFNPDLYSQDVQCPSDGPVCALESHVHPKACLD